MTDLVFVDTDVLVYRLDASEPLKQPRAKSWINLLWTRRSGRLSTQILQEYYQTVTRKLKPGLPRATAREDVQDLAAWRPVVTSPELMQHAFALEDQFALSFWDSLVVAAALRARCTLLLTEDLQDGQDIDGLLVVNPFQHEPAEFDLE